MESQAVIDAVEAVDRAYKLFNEAATEFVAIKAQREKAGTQYVYGNSIDPQYVLAEMRMQHARSMLETCVIIEIDRRVASPMKATQTASGRRPI